MSEADMTQKTLTCIVCKKKMVNFQAPGTGFQPLEGLAFSTRGHYGSTHFDPMDGSYLEICVCDACVERAGDEGLVHRGKPVPRDGRDRHVLDESEMWELISSASDASPGDEAGTEPDGGKG